ncbi:MAG: hypothetical protein ABL966_00185 [Acidimicrobiales bacterium]
MADRTPAPSFHLQLPPGWTTFTVDADLTTQLDDALAEALPTGIEPALRAEAIALAQHSIGDIERSGVDFLAVYAEIAGDDAPMLLQATLAVGTYRLGEDDVDAGSMVRAMLGGADAPSDSQVSTTEIAGRRSVRLVDEQPMAIPGAPASLRQLVVQYFVPLPQTGLVTVLSFQTPNVLLAEELTVLFDVIAEGLELDG